VPFSINLHSVGMLTDCKGLSLGSISINIDWYGPYHRYTVAWNYLCLLSLMHSTLCLAIVQSIVVHCALCSCAVVFYCLVTKN